MSDLAISRHFVVICLFSLSLSRSKLVALTKRELPPSASTFRHLLPRRLRLRGVTTTTIIITTTGTTGIMKCLPHAGSTITRRIPADPATVPSRTAGPLWNRRVIVCSTRRTGIIIVRPHKRQRAPPRNPRPGSTAAPWRPGATRAGLWRA